MADATSTTSTPITGTATTGHEWDGIRELNTPLPRWWLWTVLRHHRLGGRLLGRLSGLAAGLRPTPRACSAGNRAQAVVQRSRRAEGACAAPMIAQARGRLACRDRRRPGAARLRPRAGPPRLRRQLRAVPRRGRRRRQGLPEPQRRRLAVGRQARPRSQQTIRHGVRSGRSDKRAQGQMPAFGTRRHAEARRDRQPSPNYVRSLSGLPTEPGADLARGQEGLRRQLRRLSRRRRQGQSRARRAQPDRRDLALWLRQGDRSSRASPTARGGVMPAWGERLDDATIKALTVYVHTLGGGEK